MKLTKKTMVDKEETKSKLFLNNFELCMQRIRGILLLIISILPIYGYFVSLDNLPLIVVSLQQLNKVHCSVVCCLEYA